MQSSSAAPAASASIIAASLFALLPVPLTLSLQAIPPQMFAQAVSIPLSLPLPASISFPNPPASSANVAPQPAPAYVAPAPAPVPQKSAAPLPKAAPAPQVAPATAPAAGAISGDPTPSRLIIPSLGLNDNIVGVGLTAAGAMAVPSGSSSNVGWYRGGPMPGQVGSAVLDAHVFAAFSKLKDLSPGDSVYVQTAGGQKLHFVVYAVKTYALSQITSEDLFTPTSQRNLNLITCAGKLTADHSTYDHRLVVYARLAD